MHSLTRAYARFRTVPRPRGEQSPSGPHPLYRPDNYPRWPAGDLVHVEEESRSEEIP